ncbi:MAG: TIR domain-containing protein [Kofleriaceae bacterium]
MPSLRTYQLFISHAWTYGDDYYRLVDLLDGAPNFRWRNFSVPEHDPLHQGSTARLHAAIENQVSKTHAVLMLSGMYAAHSTWMQLELDMAHSYAKPVIGVYPWGNQRASAQSPIGSVRVISGTPNRVCLSRRTTWRRRLRRTRSARISSAAEHVTSVTATRAQSS